MSDRIHGKSLIEFTTYEEIALWWFVDVDFDIFKNKIKQCIKYHKVKIEKPSLLDHLKKSYIVYFIYQLLSYMVSRIHVKLYGTKKSEKMNRILITSQNINWRTIQDVHNKNVKKGDAFFDSIISLLRKNRENEIITTYPLGDSVSDLRTIIDKRKTEKDIVHKPFEFYWSFDSFRKGTKAKKKFVRMWDQLRTDDQFKGLFKYNDIVFDDLEKRLEHYFTIVFGIMVENIEMAKRLIEEEKPDVIVLLNEYGRFERALIIAAKLNKVPVLAIQHGVIHPSHKGYMYKSSEISSQGNVRSPYCPIPDLTAVYGTYHKDLLINQSAYPKNSVIVTGQPRYDILHFANDIYDKNSIFNHFNIDPNKKLIVWITQTHGLSLNENIKNISALYAAVKPLQNVQLLIKLHPGEDQKAPLYRKNTIVQPIIVDGKADTYALLYACDLMITRHSTTAMEAVVLNKPVIILNLSGEPDPVDYVEDGVAIGVYDESNLRTTMVELLMDDSVLVNKRNDYIKKHLYKIDGKATERIVKLVEKMIDYGKNDTLWKK